MRRRLTIISGFDGCGTAYQACKNLGIPVRYYANEIDKYAISIALKNHPDIIQCGDITDQQYPPNNIDLMVAGSPCQGFSFAGKQLAFDDPRSKLFFEWYKLFEKVKPRWFLFENVRMKQASQDVISRYLVVQPIEINSSLVSAQNRKRLYWTNIPSKFWFRVVQPEDRGIVLQDILENGFSDRDKSYCIDANYFKGGNLKSYFEKHRRQLVFTSEPSVVIVQRPRGTNPGGVRAVNGKTPTLSSSSWEHNNFLVDTETLRWRKLTPIECERLQTLPDNYTEGVSNTQRYKMLGNGMTCAVIEHILSPLKGILND